MPTRTNRAGSSLPTDTTTIHRPGAVENTTRRQAAGPGVSPTSKHTGGTPDGRLNANAEAVSGGPAPKTSPDAPGAGLDTPHGGIVPGRHELLEMAFQWWAAKCRVHPAKADGSKLPVNVDGGAADVYPDSYPATYDGGPNVGKPHPQAGKPHPKAGQHRAGWKRVSTGAIDVAWPFVVRMLRGAVDGIGIMCGAVSGNLEMVELEGRAAHLVDALEHSAAERGVLELWHRFNNGCSEWTPSGGIHWFTRTPDAPTLPNTKLALRPNPADPRKPLCFAETRGEGGWVVVAGSFGRTHKSGRPYVMRTGSPANIPSLTAAERDAIHALFRTLDEMPEHTAPAGERATVARRERPAGELLPGDDFNARGSWSEVLPSGWVRLSQGARADAWSMHGQGGRKTADHYHESDTLYVYDSDCAGSGKKLDKFAAYAWLNHGGDFHAAASTLYAAGYGSRREPRERKSAHAQHLPPAPELPPPGRVETLEALPTVSLDELRADLRRDMAAAVAARPSLVVVNAGTGVGKTERAVELLAGAYDRLVWVCTTHDAANETVARLKAAGHEDVAAIPPRDATTCRCWTPDDVAALADAYPSNRYMVPMEAALRVGNPHMACLACPLSGLAKKAVPDEAFAGFMDPSLETSQKSDEFPADANGCRCEYMRRKAVAEDARITVMCQARYVKSELQPVPIGTTRAIVIDEHGTAAVLPSQAFTLDTMRATRDALATAVDTWRQRKGRMRFTAARERENELVAFGEAVRGVADKLVGHMEALQAAGKRYVDRLPNMALPSGDVPKRTHIKIARLLVNATLPAGFNAEALDVIRRAAGGWLGTRATVYAEPRLDGTTDVQLVIGNTGPINDGERWAHDTLRDMDADDAAHPAGENRQTRFVIDADADVAAIRRAFPDVLEISPRGAAPLEHTATQWWFEINPTTHPAVVVRMLELAIHEHGFKAAGVVLPLAHRRVLFPVTRPRNGRPAEDKEPDPAAIANWGGRGGRELADGNADQRMARAVALVERVRRLREFIARDELGRLLVEHHRGTTTRGSNRFIDGTDGGVVLGCSRANPGAVAAYMLGTGRVDAVRRSNGTWGDVEGELPAAGGGTARRRWRGYACPEWAEAARLVNRAELTQTCARFRPTLEHGKRLVVVAAEPTGLPVMDPPASMPEGVAAVVAAVRELVARTNVVPECEDRQTDAGGESGQRSIGNAETTAADSGESRKPSIEHTHFPIILDGLRDSPGVTGTAIAAVVGGSTRAVQMSLADAVRRGLLVRTGAARATRYALPAAVPARPLLPVPAAMVPDLEAVPPPAEVVPLLLPPGAGKTSSWVAAEWKRRRAAVAPGDPPPEPLDFVVELLAAPDEPLTASNDNTEPISPGWPSVADTS